MVEQIISWYSIFPPELATFLISMLPIGELRFSIPIGVAAYHLPVWEVFLISIFGNSLPTLAILMFAGKFHLWVEKKSGFFSRRWINGLAGAQKKFQKYEKYGLWGLFLFIGSCLPGTGSYTGAIIAFVFGVPFRHSWPYIFGGIVMTGVITTVFTVGIDKII